VGESTQVIPILSSMHTHSRYCDGHGEIAEYAKSAEAGGIAAYGASGHAPVPFPCDYAIDLAALDSYCQDVRDAAREYRGRLPIYLGLELDFLPGLDDFYRRELFARGLEYVVASVHYVGDSAWEPWCYDETEESFQAEISRRHGGNARPAVEDYYARLAQMAREAPTWGVPVIVGHFDRIALWNAADRYFPTDDTWYAALVDNALTAIAESKLVLEINTSGWHKPVGRPNPDLRILRRAAKLGIPAIVSADAHRPEHVARDFARAIEILREAGYAEIIVPSTQGWQPRHLTDSQPAR